MPHLPYIFYGTPHAATIVLDTLHDAGLSPACVVTAPDAPQGRKLVMTPPPAKEWAQAHTIPYVQPEKLTNVFVDEIRQYAPVYQIVAAYGKIIPQKVLDIPLHGTFNVHPSLLPKYRGPSPVVSQILADDRDVGVSIMLLDAKMDHGPLVTQERETIDEATWPPREDDLEEVLFKKGALMLSEMLRTEAIAEIVQKAQEQDHDSATYTHKITKEHGRIDPAHDNPREMFLKFRALQPWPGIFFFTEKGGKNIRVKVADATYESNTFVIQRVIPEGRKEMSYADFLRG